MTVTKQKIKQDTSLVCPECGGESSEKVTRCQNNDVCVYISCSSEDITDIPRSEWEANAEYDSRDCPYCGYKQKIKLGDPVCDKMGIGARNEQICAKCEKVFIVRTNLLIDVHKHDDDLPTLQDIHDLKLQIPNGLSSEDYIRKNRGQPISDEIVVSRELLEENNRYLQHLYNIVYHPRSIYPDDDRLPISWKDGVCKRLKQHITQLQTLLKGKHHDGHKKKE